MPWENSEEKFVITKEFVTNKQVKCAGCGEHLACSAHRPNLDILITHLESDYKQGRLSFLVHTISTTKSLSLQVRAEKKLRPQRSVDTISARRVSNADIQLLTHRTSHQLPSMEVGTRMWKMTKSCWLICSRRGRYTDGFVKFKLLLQIFVYSLRTFVNWMAIKLQWLIGCSMTRWV